MAERARWLLPAAAGAAALDPVAFAVDVSPERSFGSLSSPPALPGQKCAAHAAPGRPRQERVATVVMVAPGGWRVVPIVVEREGRTLRLYRVSRSGRFVCECRTPAGVAAAGVPLDRLIEEADREES